MSFFSIKELLTRKPSAPPSEFALPYGLTPSEWAALRSLRGEEAFDILLRTLDEEVKLKGELLLGGGKNKDLHFRRGFIQGIRRAATLIDEINAAKTLHEEQERKRKDARKPRSDNRTLATFGTPGWSPRGP